MSTIYFDHLHPLLSISAPSFSFLYLQNLLTFSYIISIVFFFFNCYCFIYIYVYNVYNAYIYTHNLLTPFNVAPMSMILGLTIWYWITKYGAHPRGRSLLPPSAIINFQKLFIWEWGLVRSTPDSHHHLNWYCHCSGSCLGSHFVCIS